MAILGYFGQPRSGKSYSVVANQIIPALMKGRHVVTNIPVKSELLVSVYGGEITQLPLDALLDPEFPLKLPKGSVVILDEVWRRWPSGMKQNKASLIDQAFLKEHGHNVSTDGKTMQVVLVTQSQSDLATWVRNLVKFSFIHEKLDSVGLSSKFSIKIYKGCPTGAALPQKLLIRESISTYREEIWQFYTSATQSESDDLNVGDEQVIDKRTSIWGSGQMIAIMVSVPLMLALGIYLLNGYISPKQAQAAAKEEPLALVNPSPEQLVNQPPPDSLAGAALQPARNVAAVVTGRVSTEPPASGLWRLAGTMKRPDKNLPPDEALWPSVAGHGVSNEPPSGHPKLKLIEMAILVSLSGVRYFPLDQCEPFEDGINYQCLVDGERVTPWTGKQALTQNFPGTAGASPETASAERSEASAVQGVPPATLQQAPRMTVVPDTSRPPRTLPPTDREAPQQAL